MAKVDDGFKQSEKMLNDLERRIHKEYAQAKKEMGEKVDAYFAKFEKENYAKEQAVKQGRMSVKEYNDWRMRKMTTGKQYIAMRNTLAKDLTNTDKIAMKIVNQSLPDVYALNMNYGTYSIEKDSKINTSFTLYNHAAVERLIKDNPKLLPSPKVDIPKDLRWNQQHIQSAITQGILQGKSIPKIAEELQRVTGMDENAAIRNARTAMTGAQNAGRLDSMKRAAARGIGVKKGWLSTLDNVTRDSHVDLDGEVQELDRAFSNGLMYPGDASGRPEEVYNCRCRLTDEYDKYKTDWSNPANRNTSKLGNMTYQEWKDKHKEKESKTIMPKGVKLPINKIGNIVSISLPISDKLTGDRRERQIKRVEDVENLIIDLTNEYDSYLTAVTWGKDNNAGAVDAVGVMELKGTAKDTLLHEFAHSLATTSRVKWDIADEKEKAFIEDAKKLFREYKKDVGSNPRNAISAYSKESVDEFIAEGFALAKSRELGLDVSKMLAYNENEHKYSDKLLELIDKYFKRK
jgi:SPP1 gp7 family putative phage head morphogenesis protein